MSGRRTARPCFSSRTTSKEALLLSDRIYVMTARPGRIKAEIIVDLLRPRNLLDTESDPRFAALRRQVLTLIREEAQRALYG